MVAVEDQMYSSNSLIAFTFLCLPQASREGLIHLQQFALPPPQHRGSHLLFVLQSHDV